MTVFARIRFLDGSSYRLSADDVLWAARSVVYEGGDPAATLWTLTQRWYMARANYPSFGVFVRAFSQPVNPDWRRDGKFCRPGGQYNGKPNCSAAALATRDKADGFGSDIWRRCGFGAPTHSTRHMRQLPATDSRSW